MTKKIAIAGLYTLMALFAGCASTNAKISNDRADSNAVWNGVPPAKEVMPDFLGHKSKTDAFPESMVGVWRCVIPNIDWEFEFRPDGSIKRIVHLLAPKPINMAEGSVEGKGPDDGSYYLFVMGPCGTKYEQKTKTVRVKLITDYYVMKVPAGELEGRLEDYFEGPVSEDGKVWNVKWWNFGWLKDAALPDINLIKANPTPLAFTKITAEDAN